MNSCGLIGDREAVCGGIDAAWDFVWDRLFDGRTCMFYNYQVGDEPDGAVKHLPTPEHIRALVPNPGGYGTGMEDCMLNAGIMMDAVVSRYEATGDDAMRSFASDVFRGMELGATVSEKPGFLPRGVSPADCRSHYIDTSRDQYTCWVWGAYRLYFSDLSDDAQKESIRRCLVAMAKKMESEVTAENGWSFLREDGEVGVSGKMWGNVAPHEYLRLPMLYLLTWKVTGDEHWREQYFLYRDEALARTMDFVPLTGDTYVGLQVQQSVRLVYDLDDEKTVRETCLRFLNKMAGPYEELSVRRAWELMTEEGREWLSIPYVRWDKAKARYAGFYGGRGYYTPEPSDFREHQSYYPLRAVGEGIAVASMCPNGKISEEASRALCAMADLVDYGRHRTCAPIALLDAYWRTTDRIEV